MGYKTKKLQYNKTYIKKTKQIMCIAVGLFKSVVP